MIKPAIDTTALVSKNFGSGLSGAGDDGGSDDSGGGSGSDLGGGLGDTASGGGNEGGGGISGGEGTGGGGGIGGGGGAGNAPEPSTPVDTSNNSNVISGKVGPNTEQTPAPASPPGNPTANGGRAQASSQSVDIVDAGSKIGGAIIGSWVATAGVTIMATSFAAGITAAVTLPPILSVPAVLGAAATFVGGYNIFAKGINLATGIETFRNIPGFGGRRGLPRPR